MKLLNALILAAVLNVSAKDSEADELTDELNDETNIERNEHNLNLCFSIGYYNEEISIFEPGSISCNMSNIDSLLELGASYFSQERVWERLLGASFSVYFLLIESTLNHELGHYSEMFANGVYGTLDLSQIFLLNGSTHYPEGADESPEITEVLRMSVGGRGMAQNTRHSQHILQQSILDGGFNFFTSLDYIIHHLDITNYVFSDILTGSYGLVYGNTSDIIHYNMNLAIHTLVPFDINDTRWPSIEFRRERYEIYYNEILEENRFYDNNILGAALFNLFDPYTLMSFYNVGNYILTGDNESSLLNPFIPQFNGILTSAGPWYQLMWNFPFSDSLLGTLLSTELSIGFSPEFSFEAGAGLLKVPISDTDIYLNIGGSLSLQRDGVDFTDEQDTVWTYNTGFGYSFGELNIDLNTSIKSDGWSSEIFGLNSENILFININFN